MTGAHSLRLTLLAAAVVAFTTLSAAGQSDETCIAYMEADAAYHAKTRQLETPPPGIDPETHFAVLGVLGLPKLGEAASVRLRACVAAYQGPTSEKDGVMIRLLEADRWRCCRRMEPARAVHRFGCRVTLLPK